MMGLRDERLRAAFVSSLELAKAPESCPPPERIWDAVAGKVSPEETADLLRHSADCGVCALAWRAARDLNEAPRPTPGEVLGSIFQRLQLNWRPVSVAAATVTVAVALIIAIPLYTRTSPTPSPTLYRQTPEAEIRSLLPEGQPLLRKDCVLRWTAGPPGTVYHLTVLNSRSELMVDRRLENSEYHFPEAELSAIRSGERISWTVEAVLPNGTRLLSPTFYSQFE